MLKIRKILCLILCFVMIACAMTSCAQEEPEFSKTDKGEQSTDGEVQVPYVGENGNWWIGNQDTGVSSTVAVDEFIPVLESGTINSEDGENQTWDARLRFVTIAKDPFCVFLNDGYQVFGAFYYNKETNEYVGYDGFYGKNKTNYIYDGEYGVRLVIYKHETANEAIPVTESSKVFKNSLIANSQQVEKNKFDYTSLKNLPDPKTTILAVIPDADAGMIWSDGLVWRWSKNNELVVSAKGYQTVKVSDGTVVKEKNAADVGDAYSATILLSSLVAAQHVTNWYETVTVVDGDVSDPNKNFVKSGDILTLDALLNSALVQGDGNAANAIARIVGYKINPNAGDDNQAMAAYAAEAERVAAEIGMTNSSYFNRPASSLKTTPADLCKLYRYVAKNAPTITAILGKLNYDMIATGQNARTWTITSTTTSANREEIPEFVGGITGNGRDEGVYGFMWTNPDDGEQYITVLMGYTLATGDKAVDARQIIDEVGGLLKG